MEAINIHLNNAITIIQSAMEHISLPAYGMLTVDNLPDFMPADPDKVTLEYWNSLTEEQQKFIHYNRNFYQRGTENILTTDDLIDGEWGDEEKSRAHNNGEGVSGNVEYRGLEGTIREGQQLVFDKDGNIVTTPENRGTYDFIPPKEFSIAEIKNFEKSMGDHWVTDVNPWIEWGNSPDDTTTREERIEILKSDHLGRLGYHLYYNNPN